MTDIDNTIDWIRNLRDDSNIIVEWQGEQMSGSSIRDVAGLKKMADEVLRLRQLAATAYGLIRHSDAISGGRAEQRAWMQWAESWAHAYDQYVDDVDAACEEERND